MPRKPGSVSAVNNTDARQSPRRQVPLDAHINVGPGQSFPGQVQNISASGVFLRSADVALEIGTQVEFVLHCYRTDRSVELHIPATVTRVESHGVALRFGRYDSVVYTELIEVIYNTDRSA